MAKHTDSYTNLVFFLLLMRQVCLVLQVLNTVCKQCVCTGVHSMFEKEATLTYRFTVKANRLSVEAKPLSLGLLGFMPAHSFPVFLNALNLPTVEGFVNISPMMFITHKSVQHLAQANRIKRMVVKLHK